MRSMFLTTTRAPSWASATFGASVLLFLGAMTSYAQAPADPHAQHTTAAAAGQNNQQLMNQIAELRAQLAKLQAAVQQTGPGNNSNANSGMPMGNAGNSGSAGGMGGMAAGGKPAMPPGGGGMGMMGKKGGMGGMAAGGKAAMPPGGGGMGMMASKGEMGGMGGMAGGGGMGMMEDKGEMGEMPTGGMGSMPSAPAGAMGMCCMGEMGGMSGGGMSGMRGGAAQPGGGMAAMSAPSSAMPGQPGSSHLYHVGSTGFFLNHSQHITLTADQKYTLNRLRERAMLDRASGQRKIDQAEQELYSLTGADQLDNSKVQAKIGEIEKLRAEQRMNFIRTVGEASNALTHDQHQALMGTMAGGK